MKRWCREHMRMCVIILKCLTAGKTWNAFINYKVFSLFLSHRQFENAPSPKQTGRRSGEGAFTSSLLRNARYPAPWAGIPADVSGSFWYSFRRRFRRIRLSTPDRYRSSPFFQGISSGFPGVLGHR